MSDQPTRKMPIVPEDEMVTTVTSERGGATVSTPSTIVRVRPPIWLIVWLAFSGIASVGASILVFENGADDGARDSRVTQSQLDQQYDACVGRRSGTRNDLNGAKADMKLLIVMAASSSSPEIRAAANERLEVAETQLANARSSLKRGKTCREAYPRATQVKKSQAAREARSK